MKRILAEEGIDRLVDSQLTVYVLLVLQDG